MKLLHFLLPLLLILLVWQCGGGSSDSAKVTTEDEGPVVSSVSKIVGADEDGYFKDEKDSRFFPWGLNYFNTPVTGLIDDQLHSDTAWHIIAEDFAEMKELSANAVNIHLQYNRFMLDPWTPDPRAFDALERLVGLAEENDLYLIITGLGAYREADQPVWYDSLSACRRWQLPGVFRSLHGPDAG
jgi:hypothetical protein